MPEIPEANIFFRCTDAIAKIKKFNHNLCWIAGDWLAFRLADQAETAPLVLVINALMKAGLERGGPTEVEKVTLAIEKRWPWIEKKLSEIRERTIAQDLDCAIRAAKPLFRWFLRHDAPWTNRPWVFIPKFIHWASRGRLPLADRYAWDAAYALQREWIEKYGVTNKAAQILPFARYRQKETCFKAYKQWTTFYYNLINKLPQQVKQRLHDADMGSQRGRFSSYATGIGLVRVLDKYFWVLGKTSE
jgi:hypothetical protein